MENSPRGLNSGLSCHRNLTAPFCSPHIDNTAGLRVRPSFCALHCDWSELTPILCSLCLQELKGHHDSCMFNVLLEERMKIVSSDMCIFPVIGKGFGHFFVN